MYIAHGLKHHVMQHDGSWDVFNISSCSHNTVRYFVVLSPRSYRYIGKNVIIYSLIESVGKEDCRVLSKRFNSKLVNSMWCGVRRRPTKIWTKFLFQNWPNSLGTCHISASRQLASGRKAIFCNLRGWSLVQWRSYCWLSELTVAPSQQSSEDYQYSSTNLLEFTRTWACKSRMPSITTVPISLMNHMHWCWISHILWLLLESTN